MQYYPMIISITGKLNEWNDKLNQMLEGKMDNVFVGAVIFGLLIVVAFWGIGELNKH